MPPAIPRVSRRERPAKAALSREGIVAVALDLVHRGGLEQVTMRRLAAALDTGPASLYVYVRDTDDLHAAVLDAVLGTVDFASVAGAPETPPADGLVAVLAAYTRVLFDHPGLARAALRTRPSGPRYLALLDQILGLLAAGNVGQDRAAWAVDLLLLLATATAAEHSDRDPAEERAAFATLRAAVLGAPRVTHPHLVAVGADLFSGDGAERLAWGFRALLAGVLATPRA